MDVCDFGKEEKTFKYFSSPFALFPAISPYASFLFRNLMSHFFTHIWLQQPGCDKIRTLPAALSRAALCVCSVTDAQVMHLSFLSPEKKKTSRERMGPEVSQTHHIYSLGTTNGAGLGLFWGMKPPLARAVACPRVAGVTPPMKHTLVKYWGSNSALVQGMASGQHLQTLFCSISGFKYYIALPWQDIFSVLETGNKKNILSLGWRICPSLFQPNLTLVEFSASNF